MEGTPSPVTTHNLSNKYWYITLLLLLSCLRYLLKDEQVKLTTVRNQIRICFVFAKCPFDLMFIKATQNKLDLKTLSVDQSLQAGRSLLKENNIEPNRG